jgi:hypothetical protein
MDDVRPRGGNAKEQVMFMQGLIMDSTKRQTTASQAYGRTNASVSWSSWLYYFGNIELLDIAGSGNNAMATPEAMSSRILNLRPVVNRFDVVDGAAYRAMQTWLMRDRAGAQTGHAWLELAMANIEKLRARVPVWYDRLHADVPESKAATRRFQKGMLVSTVVAIEAANEFGLTWMTAEDIYVTGVAALRDTTSQSQDAMMENAAAQFDIKTVVRDYLDREANNTRTLSAGGKRLGLPDLRTVPYTVVFDEVAGVFRIGRTEFDRYAMSFGTCSKREVKENMQRQLGANIRPASIQPQRLGISDELRAVAMSVSCYYVDAKRLLDPGALDGLDPHPTQGVSGSAYLDSLRADAANSLTPSL